MSDTQNIQASTHLDANLVQHHAPSSQDTSDLKAIKQQAYQVLEKSLHHDGLDCDCAREQLDILKHVHKSDSEQRFLSQLLDAIQHATQSEFKSKQEISAKIVAIAKATQAQQNSAQR